MARSGTARGALHLLRSGEVALPPPRPPFGWPALDPSGHPLGGRRRRLGDGRREGEGAASAGRAVQPDTSTLQLDELLRDGKPKPGPPELAGRARVLLAELVEDVAL